MTRLHFLVAFSIVIVGGACGKKTAASCVEGQSNACACPSGGPGAQTCSADGSYGACACAGSAAAAAPTPAPAPSAAPVAATPPSALASAVAAPACDKAQLKPLLATAWKLDAAAIDLGACAAGHFPAAGFAVSADLTAADNTSYHRLAVVGADGKILAARDGEPAKDRMQSIESISKLVTTDLDGDGTDELIATVDSAYKLTPTTAALEVDAIRGAKLATLLHRGYSYTTNNDANPDIDSVQLCDATFEVTPQHALVLHGTIAKPLDKYPNDKPECVNGVETYVAHAGALAKQ